MPYKRGGVRVATDVPIFPAIGPSATGRCIGGSRRPAAIAGGTLSGSAASRRDHRSKI